MDGPNIRVASGNDHRRHESRVDRVWNAFWSGGISNPLEVIEQHLTEHRVTSADRRDGLPFSQATPRGPEALFSETEIDRLVEVLRNVRDAARAA
jgi:hypothetical protein